MKIPASIVTKYRIEEGEILNVFDMGGGIIFVPERVKQNKKLRKEFNERLWDQMEQEAENDIRADRVAGPFETVEELLRDLEK